MKYIRESRLPSRLLVGVWIVVAILFALYILSRRDIPQHLSYGVSFSKLHAEELGLDWKETYLAILNDLGVKKLRLSAHWPMVEPRQDVFDFFALDFQMQEAASHNAKVILAVGRKTPGWPECHTPGWAEGLNDGDEHDARIAYISAVVERYKDSPALLMWQVENEPFLNYARTLCGQPDEAFLKGEIDLVKKLDPDHQVVVTDGGEFGLWYKARTYGDVFGSTMYLYVYSSHVGYFRYPITPGFFRFKQNLLDEIGGVRQSVSIEVGLEPWLNKPIRTASIDEQLEHMSMDRFDEILAFAAKTGFDTHYLWGAEWWYYMKMHSHPEFWDKVKVLMAQ